MKIPFTKFNLIYLFFFLLSCEEPTKQIQTKIKKQKKTEILAKLEELKNLLFLQSIYVPVYSDIFYYNEKLTIPLTATLSIRNTDLEKSIYVSKIDYYDTAGNLIRKYIQNPIKLKALQTQNYVVEFDENKGGTGANFIVEWAATDTTVSQAIIQCVMISTDRNLGISFVTEGKEIKKTKTQ